jgi:hypothetical protein
MSKEPDQGGWVPAILIVGAFVVLILLDVLVFQGNWPLVRAMGLLTYALPLLPFVMRTFYYIKYQDLMHAPMPDKEIDADAEAYRPLILSLMGFSFTGSLALFVVDAKVQLQLDLQRPAFFLLVSFLSYFAVLNLQAYKSRKWQEYFIGQGLIEVASFSLIAALVSIVLSSDSQLGYKITVTGLSCGIWLFEHIQRLRLVEQYFSLQRKSSGAPSLQQQPAQTIHIEHPGAVTIRIVQPK